MIQWDDSPTFVAAGTIPVSQGFSKYHAKLLDICFGHYYPPTDQIQPLESEILDYNDLDKLAYMVLVEFAASVERERKGDQEETHIKSQPHAYDVFVMKTTFGAQASNVSVLLPMKGGELLWWDGQQEFAALDSDQHVYRIASLSGSSRVLDCLDRAKDAPEPLSIWAMKREKLIGVEEYNSNTSLIESVGNRFFRNHQTQVDPAVLGPLNESQRSAVITVASTTFQDGFFAIQGPPGCGKTTTMVGMISAIGDGMIVTAPSNAAVANIALKLVERGRYKFPQICIFGDGCDESVRFLNPRHRSDEYKKELANCVQLDDRDIPPDNIKLLEMREKEKETIRQRLARWLHVEESLSMSQMGLVCPDIPLDENGSVSPAGRRKIQRLMSNAQVIFCTLNSSGSFYLQDAVSGDRFQTFLLDEGGQCTEAEFFIATTFPGIKRIVVMGDPKQLRPTVLEPACSSAGYGESWLNRVYKLHQSKLHLLDTQYRMDPAILRFPNQRFYNKRIKSGDNVKDRSPPVAKPFLFIDTQGRGREERDEEFSFRNSYEIAVIRDLLKNDKDIAAILEADTNARIIIITPYKAQVRLLKDVARFFKNVTLEVSTVDSFQGQEGDIVILSTVRTRSVGFVDDAQRLNVALTRAKRVLRVVGDRKFFLSLRQGSTLRALSAFATNSENVEATKMRRIATSPPDLSIQTRWKITLTQRFRNSIANLYVSDRYILLNTLFAIAFPDLKALGNRVTEKDGWHTSWHTGYKHLRVIWVARDHDGFGIVEAHFGGTEDECRRFRQINHIAPDGCCAPRSDMSGVVAANRPPPENGRMFVSWSLDSHLQNAILSDTVLELPLSMIQLDPPQERIARSPPPLLIESRSGTGKTLVLLQHAAFYHRAFDPRPACFITVSPRLRNELEQRYEELTPIHGSGLPKTKFFSFRDFISGLLSHYQIQDFDGKDRCNFQGYIMARRSHKKLDIEAHLLENEVGGVIMGSVVAAQQGEALSREQYRCDKRSNIPNKTEEGRALRDLVFDEFERYKTWKIDAGKYDIHEAVLRLQRETPQQLFSSAYLDEVQDLSHAAIFLICGIAGKDNHYWVCGGDPAQMISPGCSFTFDGLKQTLLALESGIEKKLKKVEHLLVNYRTTKDILILGNQILATARTHFPGAIDFARPERARKDLGLKVALCSWKTAFETKAKFGDNQAFIYSSQQSEELIAAAKLWLDDHPFILSALDSKGLEFDDVLVAFDHDRKTWQVDCKREASLGMLRELYVAVTRAQRRVVVLLKDDMPVMAQFFEGLNCDVEYADEKIFFEFNRDTSDGEWFKRAQKLFQNYQFGLAAACFTRAHRQDWSFLAKARDLLEVGHQEEAAKELRRAARLFSQGQHHKEIIDILQRLLQMSGTSGATWDNTDDKLFTAAINANPRLLPRIEVVRYAILRGDFSCISVDDLQSRDLSQLLIQYRDEPWLKTLVQECSEDDRTGIAAVMPEIVYDFYTAKEDFHNACKVALSAGDRESADAAAVAALNKAKNPHDPNSILSMVCVLREYGPAALSLRSTSVSMLLHHLFDSPKRLPSDTKSACTNILGKQVVLLAVDEANLDRTVLLDFGSTEFKAEVDALLTERFGPDVLDVVKWYDKNGHPSLASQFVQERLKKWSNDDLLRIAMTLYTRPSWLFEELERRSLFDASIVLGVLSPFVGDTSKKQFLRNYLVFKGMNPDQLDLDSELRVLIKKCKKDLDRVSALLTIRWQLFEKAFLHMWLNCDTRIAVQCSWEAMETHELAAANVARVLTLWKEVQQADKNGLPQFAMETFEEKVSFLMCLFFGDEPSEARRSLYRAVTGHFSSLLLLVGPTAAAYCKLVVSQGHQGEELRQRLEAFHNQLRSALEGRLLRMGARDPKTVSKTVSKGKNNAALATGSTENQTKPLSKKAARKLKKNQANKMATANASGSANTPTQSNKKKGNNKRKGNNKKKGRR